jgi:esterase/lipase
MHSKDDHYVLPDNMELIYVDLVNASDKTMQSLTGSGHVVPRDAARQQAFQYALEFIQRIESTKESV